jgi:hypothetical protein
MHSRQYNVALFSPAVATDRLYNVKRSTNKADWLLHSDFDTVAVPFLTAKSESEWTESSAFHTRQALKREYGRDYMYYYSDATPPAESDMKLFSSYTTSPSLRAPLHVLALRYVSLCLNPSRSSPITNGELEKSWGLMKRIAGLLQLRFQ